MNAIDTILDEIIRREGGYVNHPADRGGPTNFGITAQTLGSWRKLGRPATAAEVQALTETEARTIYRQQYITAPGFETITHPALLHLLVDVKLPLEMGVLSFVQNVDKELRNGGKASTCGIHAGI